MCTEKTFNAAKIWWSKLSTTLKKHYINHYNITNNPITTDDVVYMYKWETSDI